MKKFLLALSLPLCLNMSSNAIAFTADTPTACPSAKAIKSKGLSGFIAEIAHTGIWFSANLSEKYNTDQNWSFIIGNIKAKNAEDAYDKASKGLDSIQLVTGPDKGPLNRSICRYTTTEGYIAMAMNPPILGNMSQLVDLLNS